MKQCDCKICKRRREEQCFLKRIHNSADREFVLSLMQYRDSLEVELDRKKAIVGGSCEEQMMKVKARNGN